MALVNKLQWGNVIPPVTQELEGLGYINWDPIYERKAWEARDAARQRLSERQVPLSLGYESLSPEDAERLYNWKKLQIDTHINAINADLERHKDNKEAVEEITSYLQQAQKEKEALEDIIINNRIPNPTCIYNIMECFNKPHITYNPWFAQNYDQEGFVIIPEEEATEGDIAQIDNDHMIMLTGKDMDGNPTYDWARGSEVEGMVHNGHFNDGAHKTYYRYVGNDKDKEQWRNQYLAEQQLLKNQKMEEGGQIKQVTLHKEGGSILDQLKEQLPEMEIFDLLSHFGIDDILSGGLKNTGSVSIQITVDTEDKKVPELKEIELGDNKYKVEVVDTKEEMAKGLSGRDSLPEDQGMLFDFKSVQPQVSFWMKDTKIPLDIIFINDDDEVVKVYKGEPEDETLISVKNIRYVVELNQNSGIKKGDELDQDPEETGLLMKVLAPDGSTQMELKGGERIFSRKNTKTLIRMAKRANKTKSDGDFKRLGRKMFQYIHTQDTNKPEYVEVPED